MRALVTGATGFIGRHLVLELCRRRWSVLCVVRRQVEPCDPRIKCLQGDLLQPSSLQLNEISSSVDVLFHFAAQLPANDISVERYQAANCTATTWLLDAAARMNIKSVVYASSLPVIGAPRDLPITEDHDTKPSHPYHVSKLCGEFACEKERRTSGRRITSLRITSPYGPGMSSGLLARFVSRTLRSEPIQWLGSGSRAQNFVHISDVVDSALLAAGTDSPGIYNIGGAETTTMQELARLVVRLASVSGSESQASSAGGSDPEEGYRWEVDLSRAESCLAYLPKVSLEQGVQEYLRWAESGADAPRWWKS